MEKNTKIIPVEATNEQVEAWSQAAKNEGLSRAQWIRFACNAYAGMPVPEVVKRGRPKKVVEAAVETVAVDEAADTNAAAWTGVTDTNV
jgi:phosphoserine phosphatase